MSARLPVLCAALALVFTVRASAGDDLVKFAERNRLLAQKVKTEVATALAEARALEKNDPDEAQAVLKKALAQVQNARSLAADEQTRLEQQLLNRIRDVGELARARQVGQKQKVDESPRSKPNTVAPPPDKSPAGVAGDIINNAKGAVGAADQRKRDAEKGRLDVVAGLDRSNTLTDADVTFPKDWKTRSEIRAKYAGPRLTPKEVVLLKSLNSTLSVDFKGTSLKDAIEYLQERTDQPIIVDEASLKDANVDYATDTVTFKQKSITFRTVLRKVLAEHGLTYVLKEGMIQVMTPQRARDMMVVRVYPIDDLVSGNAFAQQYGPFVARAQMWSNAMSLITTIQRTVDPQLWDVNGGAGSITFHEQGQALIIRAPAELHYQIGNGNFLGGGR